MISWDDFNADEKPTTKAQTTPAGTAQAAARVTVAPAPAMAPAQPAAAEPALRGLEAPAAIVTAAIQRVEADARVAEEGSRPSFAPKNAVTKIPAAIAKPTFRSTSPAL